MTSSETDRATPGDISAEADQGSPTETVVVADFAVTDWQQTDEGDRARAHVSKTFTGALEGTSLAELIMAGGETGRGYIAHEVFTGTLDGRRGTIVFQHGGIDDGVAPFSYGYVVPGTGTDGLAGLKGEITFAHDEAGARVRLVLTS
jgi:hypothetical protein